MWNGKSIGNGIVAGAFAGIFFALFIILGDFTQTFMRIIGVSHELNGLLIFFLAAILAGILFALTLGRFVESWWSGVWLGLVFGFVLWILGPIFFLPAFLATEVIIAANIPHLIGLLIFGLILGLAYCFLKKGKLHKLKKPRKHKAG